MIGRFARSPAFPLALLLVVLAAHGPGPVFSAALVGGVVGVALAALSAPRR